MDSSVSPTSHQPVEMKTAFMYTRKGFWMIIGILLAVLVLSIGAAVSFGQVEIPFSHSYRILLYQMTGVQIGDVQELSTGSFVDIIWKIRLPRVLMAMLLGMGLTLCGTIMQASVQNPLADPYILGISSGASLGATFAILVGFGSLGILAQTGIAFWAFAGAVGASLVVMMLASAGGKMTSVKLVLAGMVINALCTAFANFIVYLANNAEGIKTVTFWTMGSLAASGWSKLPLVAAVTICASLFFMLQSRVLNTMLLGDEAAVTLGISLSTYRRLYMILT
ncbi:MAG: hypothetical protein K0Q90_3634, partial [Paenibacillaceae bacterium]|nr:hypothetical protein [Paenibacillaceae bacterium]